LNLSKIDAPDQATADKIQKNSMNCSISPVTLLPGTKNGVGFRIVAKADEA